MIEENIFGGVFFPNHMSIIAPTKRQMLFIFKKVLINHFVSACFSFGISILSAKNCVIMNNIRF